MKNIASMLIHGRTCQTKAMKYGTVMESIAITLYLEKFPNYEYKKGGLIISQTVPYLAASADGLINNDGVIEIKCPFNI